MDVKKPRLTGAGGWPLMEGCVEHEQLGQRRFGCFCNVYGYEP